MFTLKNELIDIPGRNFNVVSVIDARADTTIIGIFGPGYKRKETFNKPLSQAFIDFIKYANPTLPNARAIVLQVNKFAIGRTTQIAFLEAKFTFYLKQDSGFYKLMDKEYYYEQPLGIGSKHVKQVVALLKESLFDLSKTDMRVENKSRFDWEDLKIRTTYPILNAKYLERGLYRNFSEFRENKPSIQNIRIVVNHSDSTFQLFYAGESVNPGDAEVRITENDDIYGFCDGQNAYFKQHGYYFDLLITHEGVSFRGFDYGALMMDRTMILPVMGAALLSGVAGGLANRTNAIILSSTYRASQHVLPKVSLNVSGNRLNKLAKQNIHEFKVNMDNGTFVQVDSPVHDEAEEK
jgi:hypothetical protein